MIARFLPAWTWGVVREAVKHDLALWLDPESGMYYPHALFSYPYWRTNKFSWPREAFLFGDSGGFSIRTLGAIIDPLAALRWQMRECTVGVVLDVPTVTVENKDIWEEAMAKTCSHTARALPMYTASRQAGHPYRWWGIIHGQPGGMEDEAGEEMEEWWRRLANVYPFTEAGEGWAVRAEPTINPVTTARALRFLRRHRITRAHFLATTGYQGVAVLLALGPVAGLEFVSFDSASHAKMGANRNILIPDRLGGLGWSMHRERYRQTEAESQQRGQHGGGLLGKREQAPVVVDRIARDYCLRECQCVACARHRADIARDPKQETWRLGTRFILHNLSTQLQVFAAQMAAARDPDTLLRTVLGKDYSTVMQAFDGRAALSTTRGISQSLLDYLP